MMCDSELNDHDVEMKWELTLRRGEYIVPLHSLTYENTVKHLVTLANAKGYHPVHVCTRT